MVRFLITTAFWGAALIKGMCLLVSDAYSDLSAIGAELIRE